VTAARPGPGIADLADVRRRTAAALAPVWPGCEVLELSPLPGGASSLTFAAGLSGAPCDRVVVKMAPPGLPPLRNRDVLRQARLLRALAPVPEIAVPAVHACDGGDPPDVPPLFVMEYVAGDSYEPLLTTIGAGSQPPPDDQVAARARAAVQMLAALHGQEPAALGLAGEPVTSLPQEYARWARAFATCDLGVAEARLEAECRRRLERHLPEPAAPAVLHGDWRLGNMQCRQDQVGAVIDWEIWSVGDPRTDLAWMMMFASPANPTAGHPARFMVGPSRLLAWYEEAPGRAAGDLDWVHGLIRYKSAATNSLLAKNAAKRGEQGERLDWLRAGISGTLDWALTFLH
jgi:aminoglycoside phosphotransferase (APT) family kinase protein